MKNHLKKFTGSGMLIVGDLMVDRFIWGNVQRISPEAPVPVVEVCEENLHPGGAANVANNVVSLGGRVFIAGVTGQDEMGTVLRDLLREKGIHTDGVIEDGSRPTTVKTRIYAHDQQVVRFDRELHADISRAAESKILRYVMQSLPKVQAIILSDYCKGVITRSLVRNLLKITGAKVFVAVDPKIGHFDYYRGVSLITPNVQEASFGSGITIVDDKTLEKAGRTLMKKLNIKALLITRGDKGMTLFEKRGGITHIPTTAKEVYDVTGAGDTVIAAFTLSHSAGMKLREAALFANHAAGLVVGGRGTSVVTADDMAESFFKNRRKDG